MRLPRELIPTLKAIDSVQVCPDGSSIVKLKKAIYGLKQSGKLWNETITKDLLALGFEVTSSDPCMFYMRVGMYFILLIVYVDDLLWTGNYQSGIKDLESMLKSKYNVKEIYKNDFSYLGMKVNKSKDGITTVGQQDYIQKIIDRSEFIQFNGKIDGKLNGKVKNPASLDLFKEDDRLSNHANQFRSEVMGLLYLAKRTRPDLLMAVSYLATRVQKPTIKDEEALSRIMVYLLKTKDKSMIIHPTCMELRVFADASFNVHSDGKSQSGILVTLGGNPIYYCSRKQNIVCRSSTEAELVALDEAVRKTLEIRALMKNIGLEQKDPTIIYQDNQSTMLIAKQNTTSNKLKHINNRYFFVREKIAEGEITLQYLSTKEMVADGFTKPLQGQAFKDFVKELKLT
jgi:hypothetical protein